MVRLNGYLNLSSTGGYKLYDSNKQLVQSGTVEYPTDKSIVESPDKMPEYTHDISSWTPIPDDYVTKKVRLDLDAFGYLLNTDNTGLVEYTYNGKKVAAKIWDNNEICIYDSRLLPAYLIDSQSGKIIQIFKHAG
jgi:hypothetical protein